MRFLNGNAIYEFTVTQENSISSHPPIANSPADGFQIDVRFREFQSNSRSPMIELRRTLYFSGADSGSFMASSMADVLEGFEIPDQYRTDMADHFKFYIERLSRRNSRRTGVIPVAVSVDVKLIPPERAAEIQMRMDARRRENPESVSVSVTMAAAEGVSAPSPAEKSAVEGLEGGRVGSGEEERECAICLLGLVVGAEVIRMPCSHVYHKDCIIRWLQRSSACPICRFKLPS